MKVFFTSILMLLMVVIMGFVSDASNDSISPFEKAVSEAKITNEFNVVWDSFVNTQFFIITIPVDSGDKTSDFRFSIFQSAATKNRPVVLVSEHLSGLEGNLSSDKAIKLSGAKLIQMLNPEVGVLVNVQSGGFVIPKEQLQWLRESMQPVQ